MQDKLNKVVSGKVDGEAARRQLEDKNGHVAEEQVALATEGRPLEHQPLVGHLEKGSATTVCKPRSDGGIGTGPRVCAS